MKTTLISIPGIFFLALFVSTDLLVPDGVVAATMYVKKSQTKLMSAESARSKVIARLPEGTPVNIVKKGKKFYQVTTSDRKKGWIFKFKLTTKAPQKDSGGDGLLGALGGDQRMAARESSSGSSIRGLSPLAEKHAQERGITKQNVDAVKQMEQYHLQPGELDRFQREGKLGEYGG